MKKIIPLIWFVIAALVFALACKHEIPPVEPQPPYSNIPTVSDSCSWDTIYFVKEILPLIISNCTGTECHDDIDPEDGISLTNYANMMSAGIIKPGRPDGSDFYEVITETDPDKIMPPPGSGSLTPEQINAIRIWIEQGARNNDCFNGCDSTNTTFATGIWPILNATCRGCHAGSNPPKGVLVTDYTTTKAIVDNGSFEKVIYHLPGATAMPPGGQLDSCSLYKVRKWLDDGAPDN